MAKGGRIVLAGTQSGVGKTTLSLGIMGALKKRGLPVKPFKVGPDYIDPQFHRFVTGEASRNLDSYLLEEGVLKGLFQKNCQPEDLAIIEGVMGLFDGMGIKTHDGSTAHLAKILKAPVVLVINGGGMSNSAAAMVLGYKMLDPEVEIKGVIINQVSGEKHYELLKEVIEDQVGVKCLGYLNKNSDVKLESRHLGLIPSMEVGQLKEKMDKLLEMVEATIDLDGLLEIAGEVEALQADELPTLSSTYNLRIAYAYDEAFNFYYQDNLDLLRETGVDLIPFSPLRDEKLPKNLHGIYLGGGFPEVFAEQLEKNTQIRQEIKEKIQQGLPTYGECGGFMYLTNSITTFSGESYDMLGVFDAHATMTNRLQRFGYNVIDFKNNTIFDTTGVGQVKGHEFHRGVVEGNHNDYVYSVDKHRDGRLISQWNCGLFKYNCLGAFSHIHFYNNLAFPKAFLESCKVYRNGERAL
ncbi:cobyrinate a,c-diamide synthase [Alkaliphilus hydrothermalis]|uniref:Cobyrinate a,c-diamide synthase n=1 Tax=Alkaliphilus hydrothermalis TaxID=1482730 RepID=A0ABS2NP56_9FIRM|nr:cobyrinate a,c-diamide synthase [Alkaliphilus hydrothermalis]MBM7614720.1 cobyrinic acid a,c-diamide synthase [Alkaliphilus hydrothermalis]